jgi:hypothetical protein
MGSRKMQGPVSCMSTSADEHPYAEHSQKLGELSRGLDALAMQVTQELPELRGKVDAVYSKVFNGYSESIVNIEKQVGKIDETVDRLEKESNIRLGYNKAFQVVIMVLGGAGSLFGILSLLGVL